MQATRGRSSLLLIGILLIPSLLSAQRNCKKGILCGNTCISATKVCHVGTTPTACMSCHTEFFPTRGATL
jgi:hypothetical protein